MLPQNIYITNIHEGEWTNGVSLKSQNTNGLQNEQRRQAHYCKFIQRSFEKHYTVRLRHHFTRFQIASVSSPGDCNNSSKKLTQNTLGALFSDLGATGATGVVGGAGEMNGWGRGKRTISCREIDLQRGDDNTES